MSRFDIILVVIMLSVLGACVADFWLITHGFPEFGSGFWSVILGVSTGEVVTFSVYRMIKKKTEAKFPQTLIGRHTAIQAAEQEDIDERVPGQTDKP